MNTDMSDDTLESILEYYSKKYDFSTVRKITVEAPKLELDSRQLDNACIAALKQLCPNAEVNIRETDYFEWGVDAIEEDPKQEEDIELVSSLGVFYSDVAELHPDLITARDDLWLAHTRAWTPEKRKVELQKLIDAYSRDFSDQMTIAVSRPTSDLCDLELEDACTDALRQLCPEAEIEVMLCDDRFFGDVEEIRMPMLELIKYEGGMSHESIVSEFYRTVSNHIYPHLVSDRERITRPIVEKERKIRRAQLKTIDEIIEEYKPALKGLNWVELVVPEEGETALDLACILAFQRLSPSVQIKKVHAPHGYGINWAEGASDQETMNFYQRVGQAFYYDEYIARAMANVDARFPIPEE